MNIPKFSFSDIPIIKMRGDGCRKIVLCRDRETQIEFLELMKRYNITRLYRDDCDYFSLDNKSERGICLYSDGSYSSLPYAYRRYRDKLVEFEGKSNAVTLDRLKQTRGSVKENGIS